MTDILIAGCGYVGTQLAKKLQQKGHHITALVQSEASKAKLESDYVTMKFNLDSDKWQDEILQNYKTIFYFIPPPPVGVEDTRIQHFLKAIKTRSKPESIVMISTTGVYGDCGDDWVNESREPQPMTDRARRRYSAEQTLIAWCQDRQVNYRILRVPGIYGSGKLPLDRLAQRTPILRLSESPWSNRIHVDDLIQACECAMLYTGKYSVFNISDGQPSTMSDFFLQVAKAFGLPEPEQISLDACKQRFSESMISYLTESKRINNQRMLEELGVHLQYPSLTQALEELSQENK